MYAHTLNRLSTNVTPLRTIKYPISTSVHTSQADVKRKDKRLSHSPPVMGAGVGVIGAHLTPP